MLLGILSAEDNSTGAARVMDGLAAGDPSLPEAQYAASMLWQRAEHGARALEGGGARARAPAGLAAGRVRARARAARRWAAARRRSRCPRGSTGAGDPVMRLSHAWQLLAEERRDDAVALFEVLRREGSPVSSDATSALASIALDEGRLDDAEQLVNDADRDPEQAQGARWLRARIAEERGNMTEAVRLYQGIESGPRALASQLRAFRLLREQGSPELGEMLLDDFQDASPGATVDVVSGVGAILVEEGKGKEAIALLDRALELLPDDGLLLARGFLLERLDRVPEAVADMRTVAKRRPNDPTALNALGYTLVDRTPFDPGGRGTDRARDCREAGQLRDPGLDGLGARAVRPARRGQGWLERAWDRSEDPEVAAHLGETLWRMGRPAEAKQTLGRGARRQSRQPAAQARDRAPLPVTRRFAVAAVLLLAGGCADPAAARGRRRLAGAPRGAAGARRWSLDGRIAVAAGEDGFSGGFDWVQTGERADVELSGPMGGSAMNIRVDGDRAVVSVGGQDAGPEDAEALLARYFGPDRTLPAGQMRYWLLGVPAPQAPAEETLGADRRLATLAQSGWQVRFDRYEAVGTIALPARLEMTTEGLRLRVVVSRVAGSAVNEAPWPAPAKLNLFLHVTGRRPDGYHEIQTVFQLIDLADELSLRAARGRRDPARGGAGGSAGGATTCACAPRAVSRRRAGAPGGRHPAREAHPGAGRTRRRQFRCRDDTRRPQ